MSRLKPELNTQMQDHFTSLPKKKKEKKKRLTFQVLHLRRRVSTIVTVPIELPI